MSRSLFPALISLRTAEHPSLSRAPRNARSSRRVLWAVGAALGLVVLAQPGALSLATSDEVTHTEASPAEDLHPLRFHLSPAGATVRLHQDGQLSAQGSGFLAPFRLEAGRYRYEVRAAGFEPAAGTLAVPGERNVALLLRPLGEGAP